jgi:hypothetical protein
MLIALGVIVGFTQHQDIIRAKARDINGAILSYCKHGRCSKQVANFSILGPFRNRGCHKR